MEAERIPGQEKGQGRGQKAGQNMPGRDTAAHLSPSTAGVGEYFKAPAQHVLLQEKRI